MKEFFITVALAIITIEIINISRSLKVIANSL